MSNPTTKPAPIDIDDVRRETVRTLDFWATFGPDGEGGWNARLNADGTPYETSARNVVAAARFVTNFSIGSVAFDSLEYRDAAISAFDYLRERFADANHGGYFWKISANGPLDTRKLAYGHAFALLAAANATKARIPGGPEELASVAALVDERFFGESDLSWDTADADWSNVGTIHSNNPNMHFCEAFITAFEATSDFAFLDRALRIARAIAKEHARLGLPIWENYDADWKPLAVAPAGVDLQSMQSPATALPGHLAEWAKLLAILHLHSGEDWLLPASETEYGLAWTTGWDRSEGGFFAAIDADNKVVLRNKHYWAPPEALGAAAVLHRITGEPAYEADMAEVWNFMRASMSDPEHGGWFKQPDRLGPRIDFRKGDEYDPDYHALGGCWEVLGAVPR